MDSWRLSMEAGRWTMKRASTTSRPLTSSPGDSGKISPTFPGKPQKARCEQDSGWDVGGVWKTHFRMANWPVRTQQRTRVHPLPIGLWWAGFLPLGPERQEREKAEQRLRVSVARQRQRRLVPTFLKRPARKLPLYYSNRGQCNLWGPHTWKHLLPPHGLLLRHSMRGWQDNRWSKWWSFQCRCQST